MMALPDFPVALKRILQTDDRIRIMAYRDLKDFIARLEKEGQLVRVEREVDSELEITEITDRVSKAFGPALLFQNVKGSDYPVFINGFGTYERMAMALLADNLARIENRVEEYLRLEELMSVRGIIYYIPKALALVHCLPIRKAIRFRTPPCQQVVETQVDLSKIPILKCWPLDGGRFVTLPLVFTKPAKGMMQNVGMYRMQVLDEKTTAMHWHKHKDGAGIYEEYQRKGRKMPVSVAIGADPAVTYAATAPLPKGISEMLLAGFLRKKSVRMVKCLTNGLYVPEESQFVLEGYVDTSEELCEEGPFGDHTGYYSLKDFYPKFHVTCITRQRDPVYPATVVGRPPMEDCYMAKATERIFLPFLKKIMPQLVNMNLPLEGVFHNCAIVSVRNAYPGAAYTVMNQIWGLGQMRYTKMIIAVSEDIDPYDVDKVLEEVLNRVDFSRDMILSKGPLDALDHSSNEALFGTRVGIDAVSGSCKPIEETGKLRCIPTAKKKPGDGRKAALKALKDYEDKLILIVDEKENPEDRKTIMWRLFNNIDGSRDFVYDKERLAVDATRKLTGEGIKRPWPEDMVMEPGIVEKVDREWKELEKYWKE